MNGAAQNLLEALEAVADGGEDLDIWRYMGNFTMEVLGGAAFGCVPCAAC
jgi:hypothetical protein